MSLCAVVCYHYGVFGRAEVCTLNLIPCSEDQAQETSAEEETTKGEKNKKREKKTEMTRLCC